MPIIYSITSEKGPKVYIGSTAQTLAQRKACHKKGHRCASLLLVNEYGWDHCIFSVLEECTTELRYIREKYYIETIDNVVNKAIPGKSDEEKKQAALKYYYDNKEKRATYHKEHYKKNWAKYKEYREENKERLHAYDKEFQLKNREQQLQRKRDWYYANKKKKESNAL